MNLQQPFAWLPPAQRRPLLQRLLIVWAVALPIGLGNWFSHRTDAAHNSLAVAMVYSYAISTFIWLFTDVARFVFSRVLRTSGPSYWPKLIPAALMVLAGVTAGYMLGTLVGDAYAGRSTWDLWVNNQSRFMGVVVSTLAISAGFTAYFYQRTKAQILASQVTQSQLMLLQAQLEPHMLFNTLAHLRALIGHDTARALAMLDLLNDYLRTSLQASRQPLHPLADEFSRLRDYLDLMAIRMEARLVFALQLPPALAATPVPSFILQPLVENAIRHGLEPQVAGGRIEVSAQAQGDQLMLTVRDSGCGISDQALAQAQAVADTPEHVSPTSPQRAWGLAHVRERLQTLYAHAAQMQVRRVPTGGTEIVLTLPLRAAGWPV